METKQWSVEYDHEDGRKGTLQVTTEIMKSGGFQYGNRKAGRLTVEGFEQIYDLRYNHGDLHMVMLKGYFGIGRAHV